MVSTRQMSIINGGCDYGHSGEPGASGSSTKVPRNAPLPGSTSPPRQTESRHILDLPQEVMEKIFRYLNYRNICQLRPVCKDFDLVCGQILNSTFQRLQTQMLQRFQDIKAKMPRRESARRNHHLACESDIIETLHMRLTLMQMTFGKHIERKHCCFFPGEILDEVYNILLYIKNTAKLSRPYKVTDELFDLSTMAMEYFKEKIEPELPEIAYFGADFLEFATGAFPASSKTFMDSLPLGPEEGKEGDRPGTSDMETEEQPAVNVASGIKKLRQGMKRYNNLLSSLKRDLRTCKRKIGEQQKHIMEQQKVIAEQQKSSLECTTRMDEYDKKNEEISRKFSTLLQELNKCKTELQYWRSKSPATPPFCNACGANAALPADDQLDVLNQGNSDVEALVDLEPADSLEILQPASNNGIESPADELHMLQPPSMSKVDTEKSSVGNALIKEAPAVQEHFALASKASKRKLDDTPTSGKNSGRRGKLRSKRVKT